MFDLISRGGPVMALLVTVSVVALGFVVERLAYWVALNKRLNDKEIVSALEALQSKSRQTFEGICSKSSDPLAKVFQNTIDTPPSLMHERLMSESDELISASMQSLPIISTIVTLTPLLGIFGTVTGIMHSFHILGMEALPENHEATKGIAQALITTAAGLGIAMPGLIFYNYFLHKSEKYESRNLKFIREFEAITMSLVR